MIVIKIDHILCFPLAWNRWLYHVWKRLLKTKGGSTIFRLTGRYGKMQEY